MQQPFEKVLHIILFSMCLDKEEAPEGRFQAQMCTHASYQNQKFLSEALPEGCCRKEKMFFIPNSVLISLKTNQTNKQKETPKPKKNHQNHTKNTQKTQANKNPTNKQIKNQTSEQMIMHTLRKETLNALFSYTNSN